MLQDFTRRMIAFRKRHPIFRQPDQLRVMDYLSCGCPDLSYHGAEAWRTSMDYDARNIGVMLCGKYCKEDGNEEDLYIAYNMHWAPHDFALPKPFKRRWELLLDTAEEGADAVKETKSKEDGAAEAAALENAAETPKKQEVPDAAREWVVTLPARSVRIYHSVEAPNEEKRRRG